MEKTKANEHGKELRYFCLFTGVLLFIAAFLFDSPKEIARGMITIVKSRDALITDYFELAGYGAAFFNAALMLLIAIGLVEAVHLPYTGLTLSAVFLNVGFAFWGKNPINILPIIFGTWCYAKIHRQHFARFVYTALFATCLAPFVTELIYILPFSHTMNFVVSVLISTFMGYIMPPLSMHTASMHMGYSLFNTGFAGGTVAFVLYSLLKSCGIESESVFLWKEGKHPAIMMGLASYFIATFLFGMWLSGGDLHGVHRIMRHPGRAVADFVMMDSAGVALMNMGLMGIVAELYILFVDGDMSGPVLGGIFTVFGFAAFGAHLKNYLPVLAGVFLSTFVSIYEPNEPSMLITALFAVGLSPIAGQFGRISGVIAGILQAAVSMCTSQLYGGLNLYNNGFSTGWVAIIMVPIIEAFMKRFELRRHEIKKKVVDRKEKQSNK